ncbi:uncharacterized protein LOC134586258 [Pelobates fuscus]|uniref:uncharacterized protein LOC134586258 n=1 Tax=Pelobates fuscus TaxID=191477 RepID=UPI002FE4E5FD
MKRCTALTDFGKRLGMELSRLQAICDYYHLFFKALNWYNQVLDQLSFKDSFWKENPLKDSDARPLAHTSLLWRRQCQIVLSQMPPQKPSEWAELITLSKLIPENQKTQGIQLASRCLFLWNIMTNHSELIQIKDVQKIISWQENLFKSFLTATRPFPENPGPAPEQLKMAKNNMHSWDTDCARNGNPLTKQTHCKVNEYNCLPYLMISKNDIGCHLSGSHIVFPPSNSSNFWLSLPLMDLSKSQSKTVDYQSNKNTVSATRDVLRQAQEKSYLEGYYNDGLMHSKSIHCHGYQPHVKDTVNYCDCGVQTNTEFYASELCSTQKNLKIDSSFCSRRNNQQLGPKEKNIPSKHELTFPRRLEVVIDQSCDWDKKEEAKLFLIEKLLANAEAILKEEELVLRQEQELENLLYQTELCAAKCGIGDISEVKTTTDQERPNKLLQNIFEEKSIPSSLKVEMCNESCESPRSVNSSDSFPDCSIMKPLTRFHDLLNELKDVHAIEERIFEETTKIQELRDQEHKQAVK